jgi:hypothetical protein
MKLNEKRGGKETNKRVRTTHGRGRNNIVSLSHCLLSRYLMAHKIKKKNMRVRDVVAVSEWFVHSTVKWPIRVHILPIYNHILFLFLSFFCISFFLTTSLFVMV